jgi:hypothetical protein
VKTPSMLMITQPTLRSCACSFPRLIIHLIYSLKSPSYCPSFQSEAPLSDVCFATDAGLDSIRSGTTFNNIAHAINASAIGNAGGGCSYAKQVAAQDTDLAGENAPNYGVSK